MDGGGRPSNPAAADRPAGPPDPRRPRLLPAPGPPGGTPRPDYSTGPDGMATPGENKSLRPAPRGRGASASGAWEGPALNGRARSGSSGAFGLTHRSPRSGVAHAGDGSGDGYLPPPTSLPPPNPPDCHRPWWLALRWVAWLPPVPCRSGSDGVAAGPGNGHLSRAPRRRASEG